MIDTTVYFKRLNNVYGQVICEDYDTVIDLREKFSFFVDGYRFMPTFKNKSWDGKVHMLDITGRIYLGLFNKVKEHCERFNIPFKLDPSMQKFSLDKQKFSGFIDKLDVHTDGVSIDPYQYQKDAAHFALENQRCILLSPTSSGKSLIQYILARMYERLEVGEQMLIVVPTVGLVTQMTKDFADYSSEIEWSADENIHGIRGGVSKDTDKKIVISTYQSLNKCNKSWFHKFKSVMVDEVHTATSKSIIRVLESCINCSWRVGLTGTLDECKTNKLTLMGLFGPIYEVIKTSELMEQGKVANLKINLALIKHPDTECKFLRSAPRGPINPETDKQDRKQATYQEEIDHIVSSKERNKFIMRLAISLKGNTIIMINKVEHGENLYAWMQEAYPDRKIYLYTGSTDANEREVIRQAMEVEDGSIIIGSLGVLSTGISIKRLHNMVFAHPSKSRIKVLQSVGRLLRKSKFGNDVIMYDIVDNFSIGSYENYVYNHGQERVRFYNDQKFMLNVTEVELCKS